MWNLLTIHFSKCICLLLGGLKRIGTLGRFPYTLFPSVRTLVDVCESWNCTWGKVLRTDYFEPNHFKAHPQLRGLLNKATKLAGAAGTKGTVDVAVADKSIAKIDEIEEIFWATKK